jgi:predicted metalloprotease
MRSMIQRTPWTSIAIKRHLLHTDQTGSWKGPVELPILVTPDSFTHGTSAQRTHWFKQGLESGSVDHCDTFGATQL